jgi:hypothetical protein
MIFRKTTTSAALMAVIALSGCSRTDETKPAAPEINAAETAPAAGEHTHGAGPNGGVVFEVGATHAEFTVDHGKQQCTILFLADDEKTPMPIAATGFVLNIKETKTADGKVVPPMTVSMEPVDVADGKAATFVGTDPGIGNVADFAGSVSGEIDNKPAMGEFAE